MGTAYLVNFGFDTSIILELLTEYCPKTGDRIVLMKPKDDTGSFARAARAVSEIKSLVSTLREANRLVELEELGLDASDPVQAAAEIADKALRLRKSFERIIVDVSGGVRSITVAAMFSATLNTNLFDEITMLAEPSRRRVNLPLKEAHELKEDHLAITLIEASCNRNLKSIGLRLKTTESSISRRINKLEEMGLVAHTRANIELTPLGGRILPLAKTTILQCLSQESSALAASDTT